MRINIHMVLDLILIIQVEVIFVHEYGFHLFCSGPMFSYFCSLTAFTQTQSEESNI